MISRRAMINIVLGTAAFAVPGTVMARRRNNRNRNNRNRNNRNRNNRRKREVMKVEQKPVEFTGVLSGDAKSGFTISGNSLPLDIDGGTAFRIKKHVGKTVKVEGSHIKKGKGKPYVRVKHVTPVN